QSGNRPETPGECLPRDWAHVGVGAEGRAGTVCTGFNLLTLLRATINVPAGSLATGSDTLTVSYTPNSKAGSQYRRLSGAWFQNKIGTFGAGPPAPIVVGAKYRSYDLS